MHLVFFRLSMGTAFVPDSIHSVLPKIHLGRSTLSTTTNRIIRDQLFDLSSVDSKNLPMSEEEFYRMKIKMKDR